MLSETHKVREDACARDVSEKLMTEPCSVARPLDQPGISAMTKLLSMSSFDPQRRNKRRERVVCTGLAALTHEMKVDLPAFEAQQADVGHEHQLKTKGSIFACPGVVFVGARFVLVLKCRLPLPPRPPGCHPAHVVLGQIRQYLVGLFVEHTGPYGDLNGHGLSTLAVLLLASAVLAALGTPNGLALELQQCRAAVGGQHDDVTTATTISAIRTAEGDVFFAPKRTTPVAPSTAGDLMCASSIKRMVQPLRARVEARLSLRL